MKGLKVIDQAELRRLEPNISENAVCALWAPTGAIVCPYELTIAAVGNAMDNGAELKLDFRVSGIEKIPGGYRVYGAEGTGAAAGQNAAGADADGTVAACAENGAVLETRYIINAAGVHADEIARMVGDDSFSIHPRRGEYVLLDKECGGLVSHTIFRTPTKMGKGILVTPTVDGNLLTGPTSVDMQDKEDKATTAEGLARVMSEAQENVRGIPFGKSITSFCGLRAVGSTGDFIINRFGEGFFNVAGIESPGLSSAPAIAEYVLSLLREAGVIIAPGVRLVGRLVVDLRPVAVYLGPCPLLAMLAVVVPPLGEHRRYAPSDEGEVVGAVEHPVVRVGVGHHVASLLPGDPLYPRVEVRVAVAGDGQVVVLAP